MPLERRRKLLANGKRTEAEGEQQSTANQIVRNSRESCGCHCEGICYPDTCECHLNGIGCQVKFDQQNSFRTIHDLKDIHKHLLCNFAINSGINFARHA